MGMVVRTNTMAVNANRQLSSNNTQVGKSLEKLSSGFRINRAGDDASGLAISEKMKAQIKGLEQASANSQDGISLIQTAEGNLTEVHDMLNRMVELAEKSANGILEDTDRSAIQDEMDALAQEIDRIADSANFNNIKLFDGSLGGGAVTAATEAGKAAVTTFDATKADAAATDAFDNIAVTGADTGAVKAEVTDATAAAKGDVTGTVGGATGAKFETAGNTDVLNGKTLTVSKGAAGSTGVTAEVDATGNMVITIGADQTATTEVQFKALVDNAFAAATAKAGATVDQGVLDAWKTVSYTAGTGGTYADVAAGADYIGATAVANGSDGLTTIELTDANGNSAVAKVDLTAASNGDTINFTGDFTASMDIKDKTKITNALLGGTQKVGESAVDTAATAASTKLDFTGKTGEKVIGTTITYGGTTYEIVETAGDEKAGNTAITIAANADDETIATAVQAALTPTKTDTLANDTIAVASNGAATPKNSVVTITNATTGTASVAPDVAVGGGKGLKLQIGDTNDDYNKLQVSMDDMHMSALFDTTALTDADYTGTLGIGTAVLKNVGTSKSLDVSSQDNAGAALKSIRKVIDKVSTQRGQLGALQNRLEHTINNLDVTNENMTAANSRIRDTDMAKEMMNYTKMNVLVQSAQAMLAQANQQPQSILQLLQ